MNNRRRVVGLKQVVSIAEVNRAIEIMGVYMYNNKYKHHRALVWHMDVDSVRDDNLINQLNVANIAYHIVFRYVKKLVQDLNVDPTGRTFVEVEDEWSRCSPHVLIINAPHEYSRMPLSPKQLNYL